MDLTLWTIALAVTALALGGLAKGILGVGLPMVATPILSTFAPVQDVVAVMFFSIFATNFYQAVAGGNLLVTVRRFWPMLMIMLVSVPLGTFSLVKLSPGTVSIPGSSVSTMPADTEPAWCRKVNIC